MDTTRRTLLAASGLAATVGCPRPGRAQATPLRIGVLGDMSGPYQDYSGAGTVEAARMAAADAGGAVLGRPVEVLVGDHQNKADVASAIARRWFDEAGVRAVFSLTNSACALAVAGLAQEKGRLSFVTGAASSAVTDERCTATGFHWTIDTSAMANGLASGMLAEGGDTWFLVTLDFAFGLQLERNVAELVGARGGRVLGRARHPINTTDFSSHLLQAQSSRAKVLGLATAGNDLVNAIKGAREFGLTRGGRQRLAALSMLVTDVHGLGLEAAQGLRLVEGFYWDEDGGTRAFARRYFEGVRKMPTQMQAADYSAVSHYLRAVAAAGTDDTDAVNAAVRARPVDDFYGRSARVRGDGRLMKGLLLLEVKAPAESARPWDYYRVVRPVAAEDAYLPVERSRCALLRA